LRDSLINFISIYFGWPWGGPWGIFGGVRRFHRRRGEFPWEFLKSRRLLFSQNSFN
jgi:hypothetical protein